MDIDRITGAVTGGVVAGLALSAIMLAGEKLTGKQSELIELKRRAVCAVLSRPWGPSDRLKTSPHPALWPAAQLLLTERAPASVRRLHVPRKMHLRPATSF